MPPSIAHSVSWGILLPDATWEIMKNTLKDSKKLLWRGFTKAQEPIHLPPIFIMSPKGYATGTHTQTGHSPIYFMRTGFICMKV